MVAEETKKVLFYDISMYFLIFCGFVCLKFIKSDADL